MTHPTCFRRHQKGEQGVGVVCNQPRSGPSRLNLSTLLSPPEWHTKHLVEQSCLPGGIQRKFLFIFAPLYTCWKYSIFYILL